ncbi:hypothetical protein HK102_013328 [Quaeritorhiza haematococci]|nr:hypothetical protein HK102_013328 [Quaeritorhiza haematococci]
MSIMQALMSYLSGQGGTSSQEYSRSGSMHDISRSTLGLSPNDLLYVLRHVVLPRKLPNKEDNQDLEGSLLYYCLHGLRSFQSNLTSENLNGILDTFERWERLQGPEKTVLDAESVHDELAVLEKKQTMPLYIRAQNAGLVVDMNGNEALVSAFQVAAEAKDVVGSQKELEGVFPHLGFIIKDLSLLKSASFAKQLEVLYREAMDMASAHTNKAGKNVQEIRDVCQPIFINDWLLGTLAAESAVCPPERVVSVRKRIRDRVLWLNAYKPFRRSGMWMMIKVVLERSLTQKFAGKGELQGRFMFKLVMLWCLLELVQKVLRSHRHVDSDTCMQLLAKVGRRMAKLQHMRHQQPACSGRFAKIAENINELGVQYMDQLRKMIDRRWEDICARESQPTTTLDLERLDIESDIQQQLSSSLPEIEAAMSRPAYNQSDGVSAPVCKPRNTSLMVFPNVTTLNDARGEEELLVGLFDVEVWVKAQIMEEHLQHLTQQPNVSVRLYEILTTYVARAKAQYSDDPVGYSRLVLTSTAIVMILDQIGVENHALLQEHRPGLYPDHCEVLLLTDRSDFQYLDRIRRYFERRIHLSRFPSIIESGEPTGNSFSVRFARASVRLQQIKLAILEDAERTAARKIAEVRSERAKYRRMEHQVSSMTCRCYEKGWRLGRCSRCKLTRQMKNMSVEVYERPLPMDEILQHAVVFDLQVPGELSILRDALYFVSCDVWNRLPQTMMYSVQGLWNEHRPLSSWKRSNSRRFSFGSTTKLFTASHYRSLHPRNIDEDFVVPNGFNVHAVDMVRKAIVEYKAIDIRSLCTLQVPKPYHTLQWAVDGTSHTQNDVLARQAECPAELPLTEFVAFGSLRAGHRLQLRNILQSLEMGILNMKQKGVYTLLAQALWQAGPTPGHLQGGPDNPHQWIRESHEDFRAPAFCKRFLDLLNRLLGIFADYWHDSCPMLCIIVLTSCVANFSPNEEVLGESMGLLLRCRDVTNDWEKKIEDVISRMTLAPLEEVNQMRLKLVEIAACSALTFGVDSSHLGRFLSTDQHVASWLQSVSRINDKLLLSGYSTGSLSIFRRNLIRRVRYIGWSIESKIRQSCLSNQFRGVDLFVGQYWSDYANGSLGSWGVYASPANYWVRCTFTSLDQARSALLQINIVCGNFLVDGQPVGRLPEAIMRHEDYQRVFSEMAFEVQPAAGQRGRYITLHPYHDATYSLSLLHGGRLVVEEKREDGSTYELFPHRFFNGDLPHRLIHSFSHWFDKPNQCVVFRPVEFLDKHFAKDSAVAYKLCLETGLIQETATGRCLVDIKSLTFGQLYDGVFRRLEWKAFVEVFASPSDFEVSVDIPRMGLQFRVDNDGRVRSREYHMRVAKKQYLGTLVGLQQGLLLEEDRESSERLLLVMPHSRVVRERDHTISISLNEALKHPSFFVYEVDHRLRQLRGDEGLEPWLYLALLHANTSFDVPDVLTGLTGTEMALMLLQSPRCWTCRPLTQAAADILHAIGDVAPHRTYYPYQLKVMESVGWPKDISSLAANDAFFILARFIVDESKRLDFAYKRQSNLTHAPTRMDMDLLIKAYWHSCEFYNQQGRLQADMEQRIGGRRSVRMVFGPHFHFGDLKKSMDLVRRLAFAGYNQRCLRDVGSVMSPKSYLITKEYLEGFQGHTFESMTVSEWIKTDFRHKWLDLYDYARSVVRNGLQKEFMLMLSVLAFRGDLMSAPLTALQRIAFNWQAFVELNPPRIPAYNSPAETTISESKIESILQTHQVGYLSYFGYSSAHSLEQSQQNDLSRSYKTHFDREVKTAIRQLKQQWPTSSIPNGFWSLSTMNMHAAAEELRTVIQSWYNNHTLSRFLDCVESKLNGIRCEAPPFLGHVQIHVQCSMATNHGFRINLAMSNPSRSEDHAMIDLASSIFSRGSVCSSHVVGPSVNNTSEKTLMKVKKSFPFADSTHPCPIRSEYMISLKRSWRLHQTSRSEEASHIPSHIVGHMQDSLKVHQELSKKLWNLLENALSPPSEDVVAQGLYHAGLWRRITPSVSIPLILRENSHRAPDAIRNLLGGLAVVWTHEQRTGRCLALLSADKKSQLLKELENGGHENWSPRDWPEWLLLELEMNVMIRPVQVDVARKMMDPPGNKNTVMQLNMGEGKTMVIIPMLAAALADGARMVRLTVLKSLFQVNFNSLALKIGGLLNRRVYTCPCRRDLDLDFGQMLSTYTECREKRGVFITVPEHCLSFKLKTLEKCRIGDVGGAKALAIQHWLDDHARDILDESDEILHFKYQLVYTVGAQRALDGCAWRCEVVEAVLDLVRRHGRTLSENGVQVEYEPAAEGPHVFPHLRLLSSDGYQVLSRLVVQDILSGRTKLDLPEFRQQDRESLSQFLVEPSIAQPLVDRVASLFASGSPTKSIILALRGIIAQGVLFLALGKRWRVNYGVSPTGHRLMAVPFRAKDVAAERTEFGHPDVAIMLTYLSYYYSGLSDDQLEQCFDLLEKHSEKNMVYASWIARVPTVPDSLKELHGVNLSDFEQRENALFPMLRKNTAVIDFWLTKVVFVKECKQFEFKISTNPWDLCAEATHSTTGFSGTNDMRLLLPLNIKQDDLPELEGTNGKVLRNILLPENDNYRSLPPYITGRELLKRITNDTPQQRVLLDVGALILELSNEEVAKEWLQMAPQTEVEAAVYFDAADNLVVRDRQNRVLPLELSSYKSRLDRCVIYLDDVHTRGTDLKFSIGMRAAVTLGKGVTKDRLTQACMRMRMLGQGHTLSFWASAEVHNIISSSTTGVVHSRDVMRWAIDTSCSVAQDGFLYWGVQGIGFCRRDASQRLLFSQGAQAKNNQITFGNNCTEVEVTDLEQLYGKQRTEEHLGEIISAHHGLVKTDCLATTHPDHVSIVKDIFSTVGTEVIQKCSTYVPIAKRYAQLLGEEQEKELEQELEEIRQVQRPGSETPYMPTLPEALVRLAMFDELNLLSGEFLPLPDALQHTTLWPLVEVAAWSSKIFVTRNFVTVIERRSNSNIDEFLRPVRWMITLTRHGGENLRSTSSSPGRLSTSSLRGRFTGETNVMVVLISPFEANHLKPLFAGRPTTASARLHMFAPRIRTHQQTLFADRSLILPSPPSTIRIQIPPPLIAQLSVFSSSLFFETPIEQEAFCDFLGFCPRPRTSEEQQVFERGHMQQDGYVPRPARKRVRLSLQQCGFDANPSRLVMKLIDLRNYTEAPSCTHVGRILRAGVRPLVYSFEVEE